MAISPFSDRRSPSARIGIVWWRWSAAVASGISGVEALFLILVAFAFEQFEFAWIAAPFVAFAFVAALTADPLLILAWLFLARHGFLLPRFFIRQLAIIPERAQS